MSYLSSGGSGGTGPSGGLAIETPVGAIDGVNVTFTVSNLPVYISLNGSELFEGDGYTRSILTLTLAIIPQTGSTLRSAFNS